MKCPTWFLAVFIATILVVSGHALTNGPNNSLNCNGLSCRISADPYRYLEKREGRDTAKNETDPDALGTSKSQTNSSAHSTTKLKSTSTSTTHRAIPTEFRIYHDSHHCNFTNGTTKYLTVKHATTFLCISTKTTSMHHTKTHHRSAKHTTKSVSHTKKHHHSLTKKITSSVKKHHTKAKKTPTTTKRVIAKSTTSTKKHTTKKHTTKKHITKKHTTKKHTTKKHTTKKHTTKKHTTTKHTTKKHTTITKVAIHTSHTTTRSIPTTSAVPIPVVVPVAKSEDTSNIGSINQNNVESSYNAQNDSADASSANNSDNAENADNADSADSNDSDDSDDSDNSDDSDENDDSDDSGSEDSSEVPAAQPSTTDPNAGNTDTTITSQSVNSAAVDAQHENKTIGISIGAVVGCVAAAGLAGMFITRRRQNARQDSDLEKHERSMGSSSVEGEVNTRWRPQSFMAAVAGAVAKLPKRSPSSSSQNNEGGPGAVRSVFGSIRRAASNASSLRSWGSRRSAGSTASSQHSYGIAVTTPVPQLARVDGGDINQQDVIDGRYNNHNHAY